jgi:hypothetical protein
MELLISVVGSLIAVAIVLGLERQQRPDLCFEIERDARIDDKKRKYLRLRVRNRPLPAILGSAYERQPALMCRAWITFLNEQGLPIFPAGDRMPGRWSDTPEPHNIFPAASGSGPPKHLPAYNATVHNVDIAPGDRALLDVVMREQNKDTCVGWSNAQVLASLEEPLPLPPGTRTFPIEKGRYFVHVQVQTGGRSFAHIFRLVNDVSQADFRLEEPDQQPRLPESVLQA